MLMSTLNLIQERWEEILSSLKEDYGLSDVSYVTWLKPLRVIDILENEHKVVVNVPLGEQGIEYISKKYTIALRVKIEEFSGFHCEDILYVCESENEEVPSIRRPKVDLSQTARYKETNLQEKYTFDSFVVGSNNQMAHAASLAVAENPGEIYNPLFIYSGVGLGKTHLMHAIGNFVLKNSPEKKVLYVSSEVFTNELINAIRARTTSEFHEKYRNIDVLLIDDIQFIAGKESTIEEFFHTFNELYNSKKAIVITSDRSPKEFAAMNIEERLVSRFEWGFPVDIQSPDYETRVAILRKKEELENYRIDNEVIQYIARNITTNIRELEGALTKVVHGSRLTGKEIDLDFPETVLKDMISTENREPLTPSTLLRIVADHFMITPDDILSTRRDKNIMLPRQIFTYLCRSELNMKQQAIGQLLDQHHTTVLHSVEKIQEQLDNNSEIRGTVEALRKKLTSYNT